MLLVACGNKDVEVTIPTLLAKSDATDIDKFNSMVQKDGIEVTQNNNGSLTYTMTKETHAEIMTELGTQVDGIMADMTSGNEFPSIQDISSNETYSEFVMSVDRERFESSFDQLGLLGLAMSGLIYQLFDGASLEEYQVVVNLEDANTGDVFNAITYPDALNPFK